MGNFAIHCDDGVISGFHTQESAASTGLMLVREGYTKIPDGRVLTITKDSVSVVGILVDDANGLRHITLEKNHS